MRTEARAQYICLAWHEHGVRTRRYLADVPYSDLAPEERKRLNDAALAFLADTDLKPRFRERKLWRKTKHTRAWWW